MQGKLLDNYVSDSALPEKRRKAPAFRHGDISRALAVAFVLTLDC